MQLLSKGGTRLILQLTGKPVLSLLIGISSHSFLLHALGLFAIIAVRYLIAAGMAWWLIRGGAIQLGKDDIHDLRLSVVSALIFAIALPLPIPLPSTGLTRIYDQPATHGPVPYTPLTPPPTLRPATPLPPL